MRDLARRFVRRIDADPKKQREKVKRVFQALTERSQYFQISRSSRRLFPRHLIYSQNYQADVMNIRLAAIQAEKLFNMVDIQ